MFQFELQTISLFLYFRSFRYFQAIQQIQQIYQLLRSFQDIKTGGDFIFIKMAPFYGKQTNIFRCSYPMFLRLDGFYYIQTFGIIVSVFLFRFLGLPFEVENSHNSILYFNCFTLITNFGKLIFTNFPFFFYKSRE